MFPYRENIYTVAIRRARIDGLHAAAIAAVVSLPIYLPIYFAFSRTGYFVCQSRIWRFRRYIRGC
jgi:hypothetical protein